MAKIKIKYEENFGFTFNLEDFTSIESLNFIREATQYKYQKCDLCSKYLSRFYTIILRRLEKAGLLDEDYKPICCTCYTYHRHRYGPMRAGSIKGNAPDCIQEVGGSTPPQSI